MADEKEDSQALQEILTQQAKLIERVAALEAPHAKDIWDKLGTLTGVIVAIVGGLFSVLYSHYQSKQDETNKQHQAKIQEIQAVGTFMPYLIGRDPNAKFIALSELGDSLGKPAAIVVAKGLNSALAATGDNTADPAVVSYLQNVASTGNTQDQKLAVSALKDIVPQPCSNPMFPSKEQSVFDQTTCQLAGNGGPATSQNELKNNFCPVGNGGSTSLIKLSISEFADLQTKVQAVPDISFGNPLQHPLTKQPGPIQDRSQLTVLGEGRLVQLQGYVKVARQEGAESVNCGAYVPSEPAYHNIHISIVASSGDAECSGVVVDMSPRHRPAEWTAPLVNRVAAARLLVRITGQLMFNSSHTPCIGGSPVRGDPSTISLWEIHPIYKFEVCSTGICENGGWVPLEEWRDASS